ncbi:MAG TPA: hypothetical protein VJJ23_02340 [Candidatus Nanoarchaeia archaeon]|nr:hypothetical protein [Candidatus Nanoarchaeia archaeon]
MEFIIQDDRPRYSIKTFMINLRYSGLYNAIKEDWHETKDDLEYGLRRIDRFRRKYF